MVRTLKIFSLALVAVFTLSTQAKAVVYVDTTGNILEMDNGISIIHPDVFGTGGGDSSSIGLTTNFHSITATLGQATIFNSTHASNLLFGGFWNEGTLGINAPYGSVTIGAGTGFIFNNTQTLTFVADDADGTVDEMRYTDDGTLDSEPWVAFIDTVDHTFATVGEGARSIHVQYKDNDGYLSPIFSDTSFYDITAPVDGTVLGSVGNSVISLSLTDFTDAASGIDSFQILYSNGATPVDCSSGTLLYDGTISGAHSGGPGTFYHFGAINNQNYYYRVCATDLAGNQSLGAVTAGVLNPSVGATGLTFPSGDDTSALPGVERTDSGLDTSNYDSVTLKPKIDFNYIFQIVYKTSIGEPDPISVKVYISDRLNSSTYYDTDLTCTGTFSDGAYCSVQLKFGPASTYSYYFEVLNGYNLTVKMPVTAPTTSYTGPAIELLNGYTMAGISRDVSTTTNFYGIDAFNDANIYRWISQGLAFNSVNYGFYALASSGAQIANGEGYFVWKGANLYIPLNDALPDLTSSQLAYPLKPGWNAISNPYNSHIDLKNIEILREGDPNGVDWNTAANYGWVINAMYYYLGSDWGSTYSYEYSGATPEPKLAPWLGYWIYLNQTDSPYHIIFKMP